MSQYIYQTRLTKREKEIIELLSLGYKTIEIAQKLFIGYETVKSHRKNIVEKTGAKNTVHLIRIAYENQLVDFISKRNLKTA